MTPFTLPWSNPDLDIHPDPPEGWHRVAVVGLWTDAKKLRKDWPDAAVCGPLRTLRGIDLLVRGLLANPQIQCIVSTGRDLSPGRRVEEALAAIWDGDQDLDAADLRACPAVRSVLSCWVVRGVDSADLQKDMNILVPAEDRPGGAIFLPPPPPPENPELPAGLPGQRVTGKTLAEVWPRVLAEVMRFGDQVPTSYGGSRELLNLVSVIEDPAGTLTAFGRDGGYEPTPEGMAFKAPAHPILGISWADLDDYYTKSFMGEVPPEGVSYNYGSRLRGIGAGLYRMTQMHTDQLAAVRKLLTEQPGTRAAYLTPWRPDEDAGKESGRPCLVGAWFRATGSGGLWEYLTDGSSRCTQLPASHTLNLSVQFRSHDLYGAYPLNLAACCFWLCEEAKALGMEVGTVTCLSMSAHVYERDLEAAGKVAEQHVKPGAWSQDPRSAWRVWRGNVHEAQPDLEDPWAMLSAWRDSNAQPWLKAGERVCKAFGAVSGVYLNVYRRKCYSPCEQDRDLTLSEAASIRTLVRAELADGLPPVPTRVVDYTFHAEATDPEGTHVLQAFEAPTKERLIKDIQASGLVTSVQHALWLGAEVGKL